jgi:hypothetical protein
MTTSSSRDVARRIPSAEQAAPRYARIVLCPKQIFATNGKARENWRISTKKRGEEKVLAM